MKQINGTITLSFLEEDNQQRVIFRVVPLCTREGAVFREKTVEFPDQGSLRIVPDKREQSTFKERMRAMGCLCAIQLCSEGKELAKVRQNRNYDPGQGECNQFAIYSDVICEFSAEGVFEVFEDGADFSAALTERVLLRRGKVLYGPVERDATVDGNAERPFGNENYLLHTVLLPDAQEHSFYWDPEQTINWRQRRSTLRRGKQRPEDAEEEADTESTQGNASEAVPAEPELNAERTSADRSEVPTPAPQAERVSAGFATAADEPARTETVKESEKRPETVSPAAIAAATPFVAVTASVPNKTTAPLETQPRQPRAERRRDGVEALPIGTRLSILDDTISFEEQISKLDQPLSNAANLLAHANMPVDTEPETIGARFSGTPLVHIAGKAIQPIRNGEALHSVVERQVRAAHHAGVSTRSDFQHVDNPIDDLHIALDKVWQSPEIRQQAMQCLCDNDAFSGTFLRFLQQRGREVRVVAAAQEQLEDIEAERLSLLMQLETVKTDRKRAAEALCAEMNQKKHDEIARLDQQIQAAKAELESLNETLVALGDRAHVETLDWFAEKHLQLHLSDGETVTVVPMIGVRRTAGEMITAIRVAMNRQGFACNEDDATELLLHFAINDEFCLCGDTVEEAELCARTMLDALGLLPVSARTREHTRLEVASFLPINGLRTPTVELTQLGRATGNAYGHKVMRLTEARAPMLADTLLPVVYAPAFRPGLRENRTTEPARPAALESFTAIRDEVKPLMMQGECWFCDLEKRLMEQNSRLAGSATQQMRVFVSAASPRLRGGFLAAADAAMLGWVIPAVSRRELNPEPLRAPIESLPRCLSALGIL